MTLLKKRNGQVEEMDVSDDVDLVVFQQVFFESLWVLSPILFLANVGTVNEVYNLQHAKRVVRGPFALHGSLRNGIVEAATSDLGCLVPCFLCKPSDVVFLKTSEERYLQTLVAARVSLNDM